MMLETGTRPNDLTWTQRSVVSDHLRKWKLTPAAMVDEIAVTIRNSPLAYHGGAWYLEAYRIAVRLADTYGFTTAQAAAVLAAVSPRMSWPRNQLVAERVLRETRRHNGLSDLDCAKAIGGALVTISLLPAVKIARGQLIDSTLTGVKRRSFYNNILYPFTSDDVTVDTWMQRVPMHATTGMTLKDSLRFLGGRAKSTNGAGAGYVAIADAVRVVASQMGVTPSTIQAAYWTSVAGSVHGGHRGSFNLPSSTY